MPLGDMDHRTHHWEHGAALHLQKHAPGSPIREKNREADSARLLFGGRYRARFVYKETNGAASTHLMEFGAKPFEIHAVLCLQHGSTVSTPTGRGSPMLVSIPTGCGNMGLPHPVGVLASFA